ncbi:MAG: PIN domain-containing protein [Patescibacteria group bacterium]|nr:PIN domain-containing protein [Patescibacteria group bacterium]
MRKIEKVIFDTNTLRNTEPKTFLGGRDELKKFSEVSEIIFPDIVIDELKHQKRKSLEKSKSSFLSNPFHWLINLNEQETQNFDNDAHISQLEINEDIKYFVIQLTDYTVLEKIKDLAINKLPPFEDSDGTDKGFKDAYIYFTILEYLQSLGDKYIFVCTKDGRLKEALEKHQNIKVIEDFESFKKQSISSFYDDYFIQKLKNEVNNDISEDNILDFWMSINGNQILLIELNNEEIVVEIDTGEIISVENKIFYEVFINELIGSASFASTHQMVSNLFKYKNYFSEKEIINILEASITNSQISIIIKDSDVKQFISDLFEAKKEILTVEIRDSLEYLLKPSQISYDDLPF